MGVPINIACSRNSSSGREKACRREGAQHECEYMLARACMCMGMCRKVSGQKQLLGQGEVLQERGVGG